MDNFTKMKRVSIKIMNREKTIIINGVERKLTQLSEMFFVGNSTAEKIYYCDSSASNYIREFEKNEKIETIL